MNIYLIIREVKYGAIDADGSSWHGYYIIKFSSSPYTFQADLSIDGQVNSSVEMVCEVYYSFSVNIDSNCYFLQQTKYINTVVYLRTIINVNANVICYYPKGVIPLCLQSISQNDSNTFSPLYIPVKEH